MARGEKSHALRKNGPLKGGRKSQKRLGVSQCHLLWANPAQAKGISLGEVLNSRGLSGGLPRVHQPYVFGLHVAIKILTNLAAARLNNLMAVEK
jgi:hypothetical protein